MEIMPLFLRTVLVYIVVFLTMRLMGKREIGKLSIFDLVISIIIAEIAVFIIDDLSKPIIHGLIPITTLVLIQIGTAKLSLHSQKAREILDGTPSYLIKNGRLDRTEMKRQRYNLDDLMVQLRQNRVMNVADVEFAILETSGKLTVVEKTEEKRQTEAPADPFDTIRYEGLPLPLIMDGKVQDQNLSKLGKTRFWLKSKIQERGVKEFKEVFFCSVDHKGVLFLDKKR
ncbi:MAG: hypothetical protein K0Q90_232 [Paenibacillaceae bacterium]|jgi:uncharacterized membrane protein YcaP (DUF421 family)|nr:hypothetical protein [Paenibacillaceae bacterium]